jgi:hypothetical protein
VDAVLQLGKGLRLLCRGPVPARKTLVEFHVV